jgi:ferrous-iron efflux pump FieF
MRWATYASVTVAVSLIAVKSGAWYYTNSVSILTSLIDSLLDSGASIINLVAVRHALTPADREHRFGHGKAESIAALGQAAIIAGSAAFLLLQGGNRLMHPEPLAHTQTGVLVMVISLVVTVGLLSFQRHVVKRTKSVAISADSLHYLSDLFTTAAVIVALLLSDYLGWKYADPVFALAIAIYILYSAWRIAASAFDQIMDREFPDQERDRIRDVVMEHPEVLDMHDLRTRSSGTHSFIQLHLELDGKMTLERAHQIADEVQMGLEKAFPEAEVLIHQDPEGLEEPPVFH